ncbi:NADH-ubiquinone oxidoreductase-F iron-sulfur binding region domain-containing protein [Occallatibacter riparius]|uniref:FAD-dependent oxidoreductase n=1 Tax=Occallatibacter riparius TaxID=1002689 RepID=A0A9J7BYK1_9BACT|nr:NADH-ubiquinone oxidoreductase-F iron-sulfur binding region domain-containing protein [Occallatibacter riparius]UWZ86549.1 FAD-dependent oxidoreductase [Occallatibacter riparius]
MMPRIQDIGAFNAAREAGLAKLLPNVPRVTVGMGTCGRGNGAEEVYHALLDAIDRSGQDVLLAPVGCFGSCFQEPLVTVRLPGGPLVILKHVLASDASRILEGVSTHVMPPDLIYCKIEEWDHLTGQVRYGQGYPEIPLWNGTNFFKGQKKIVLRDCGLINPEDIEEYIGVGGYQALYKVLIDGRPETVIEQVKAARLRGRGGAGFLTGNKWDFLAKAKSDVKYVICNADEGDPGAYMNRNELEGDPHSMLEGMIIGAYATGATDGIIYVRAEYPLAVHRLSKAIEQAREYGLLGKNILDRGFNFDIELIQGAGAFVCGEETALIASLEDAAGRPRSRPPYPAQSGLWGKPTNINNVETWCNIPPIIARGAGWFAETGSVKSPGTKVFSLVGKIRNTGLVEMPLGTPLKSFIYDIGEGGISGRPIKAVQTGGPSGGCIPAEMLDTPVDYESLAQIGSIMGSGGMVVMDEDNCMVDVARYFIEFTHSESCGKCVPCRVGLDKALRILNNVTKGQGNQQQLALLDQMSRMIRECSLCGLGQSAPNPVLTTIRHFRDEYEDHILAHRCSAGVCQDLAVSPCENSCPLRMNIPRFLELYQEGRLEDAFASIILDNPLPASTGRVCQHPCDTRCRRQSFDEVVNIREVHRFIADSVYTSDTFDAIAGRLLAQRLPTTGKKVAVAGSGPTGLTTAFYLAMLGHDVTVFEERAEAGGMLRFAIPEYRLPKDVLRKEVALIERAGVRFIFNTRVGIDVELNDLASRFDAVFLSIGTWKESWLYLPGTELKGVHPALPYLEAAARGESVLNATRVAVIGGGNAAIDSARTLLRQGASATIFYRRERKDMPAIDEEIHAAEEEGVRFVFLAAPHRILGDSNGKVKALETVKTRLGEYDKSGRRRPVLTDEVQRFECDGVILAVGETFDLDFCRASGLELKEEGTIKTDRLTFETSRAGFYAGGDVITGASNVSNAMGAGKQAAQHIDERLTGERRWQKLFPEFDYSHTAPGEPSLSRRHAAPALPAGRRIHSQEEVVGALTAAEALEECRRCLHCDLRVLVDQNG